jgi:ABC-type arginine transport system permease subunit
VDRQTLLWVLVVFFGASIVFRAIRRATEDEPIGITLLVGFAALVVIIGAISFVVRRRQG